jgi:hypothetical protein
MLMQHRGVINTMVYQCITHTGADPIHVQCWLPVQLVQVHHPLLFKQRAQYLRV